MVDYESESDPEDSVIQKLSRQTEKSRSFSNDDRTVDEDDENDEDDEDEDELQQDDDDIEELEVETTEHIAEAVEGADQVRRQLFLYKYLLLRSL